MLLLAPKYDKSQFYPTLFALEKENKNPDSLFHVLTECIHWPAYRLGERKQKPYWLRT